MRQRRVILHRMLAAARSLALPPVRTAERCCKEDGNVKAIDQKWQKNGEDIAEFLSKANPNWPKATLADMMKMHLTTTTNEVMARLDKEWNEDVKAFDEVYDHILKMADALSDGIVKQFPDRF